jgi:uncharacterized protein
MIQRQAEKEIRKIAKQFRALAIVGPRQSGKTTLVKKIFPTKPYVSLEDPDTKQMATEDPRHFLSLYKNGAIIDEAQRVPALFSYLQGILDNTKKNSLFVLTGSNNFLLQENISQSLAGRIGYFDLPPLSIQEIKLFGAKLPTAEDWMLNGSYPEIFDKKRNPASWYASYIRTYVERDVRMIRNIANVNTFTKFLKLCAGRASQQLNISNISIESGIDIKTIQSWLSILESSFIIYQLPAHHKNFNRRLVKTPKLYFYDTGLACNLLGIKTAHELSLSPFRGAMFENFIVSDIRKQQMNKSELNNLFYWRDNKGVEIDMLLEVKNKLLPIEIKAGKTVNNDFVKNINFWNELAGAKGGEIIYGGSSSYTRPDKIKVTSFLDI